MCWDFSDCGNCGYRTYCSSHCYCSKDMIEGGECQHRSCKSFEKCYYCDDDLCDNCNYTCAECGNIHCEDHSCAEGESDEDSESAIEDSESRASENSMRPDELSYAQMSDDSE